MKITALSILLLFSLTINSQNLHKENKHFIDISIGGGSYNCSINNSINKNGQGGQTLLGINYEHSISKRFGIGGSIEIGGSNNPKLNTNFSSSVIGIKGCYHFYNGDKSSIFTTLSIGINNASSLIQSADKIYGSGKNLQLGVGLRKKLYFNWLGWYTNISLIHYRFDKWESENKIILKNNLNDNNMEIVLNGINFTSGLNFRF